MSVAYVDASALVKLLKAEHETETFRAALADWPVQVASELIRVEAVCTARRLGDEDTLWRADAALERINLVPLSSEVIELATGAHAPPLRAMDAIHLATDLTMREDLGAIFIYTATFTLRQRRPRPQPARSCMSRGGAAPSSVPFQ